MYVYIYIHTYIWDNPVQGLAQSEFQILSSMTSIWSWSFVAFALCQLVDGECVSCVEPEWSMKMDEYSKPISQRIGLRDGFPFRCSLINQSSEYLKCQEKNH